MSRQPAKAPTQRQLRVGEEIRHAVALAIERGEIRDPALFDRPVTVTEVRLSPDLKNATAFVLPLGGSEVDETVEALNRASAYLRGWVAKHVRLRHVPRLTFTADISFDVAQKINDALNDPRVARDLAKHDDAEDDDSVDGAD